MACFQNDNPAHMCTAVKSPVPPTTKASCRSRSRRTADATRVKGTSEDRGGTQGLVTAGSRYYPWAEGTQGVTLLEPTAGGGQGAGAVALGAGTKLGPSERGGMYPNPTRLPSTRRDHPLAE